MITASVYAQFEDRRLLTIQSFDVGTSSMPHGRDRMVGGYDYINQMIWILGMMFPTGSSKQTALWSLNINKWNKTDAFINYGENWVSAYVYTYGQSYTQQDNILYIINREGSVASFHHFNLSSQAFTSNWKGVTIPQPVTTEACLTNINNHLIVSAGNTVQIYNIAGNVWLDNVPLMINPRIGHACNAYNDQYIYQIGGYDSIWGYHNSVERLYVGDMENVANQKWIQLDDKLSNSAVYIASVIHGDHIYVIGGYHGSQQAHTNGQHFQNVDVIHVLTDRIISRIDLALAVSKSLPIIANDRIYVFGGETNVGAMTNKWQYYDIPPPTPYPTKEPTQHPTVPTVNPTNSPSDSTINPTKYPTTSPHTKHPTVNPTLKPTRNPTLKPTVNPTLRPTIAPTLSPTVFGECGFAQLSGFKYPLDYCFASNYSSNIMSYKYSCQSGVLYYNIYQSSLDCSIPATTALDYSANVDEFSCSPYKCNYVGYTYWYNEDCTHGTEFISNAFVINQCLHNSYNDKYQKVTCTQDAFALITYIDDACIEEYQYTPSPLTTTTPPTPPPVSMCLEISHCQTSISSTKSPQSTPSNDQSEIPSSPSNDIPSLAPSIIPSLQSSDTPSFSTSVISLTSSGVPSSGILPSSSTTAPSSPSVSVASLATVDHVDAKDTTHTTNTMVKSSISTDLVPESTLNEKVIDDKLSLVTTLILIIGMLILCLCICGVYVYYLRRKRGHRFEKGMENYVEENEIEMETEETNNNKNTVSGNTNQSDGINTASITLLENN